MMKNLKKFSITKKSAAVGIVAILLIAGGAYFYISNRNDKNAEPDSTVNIVDYGPPSEEEQVAGDTQKTENTTEENAVKNNQATKNAQIVLIDANQYFEVVEVRAYISNQYEDGGTCTAIFTKDGQTVTQKSTAFKDVSTTQCGAIDLPRSSFPAAGPWQLVVEYSSASSSGKTTAQTVTIK